MKQENRFVAQLFHFLAPFVDYKRDLLICVDGGAALHHSSRDDSPIMDPDIPDLWFAILGKSDFIGIEAKIIESHNISVRQGQLQAWRANGNGHYIPKFWVASDRNLENFYAWKHSTMEPRLNASKSTTANVKMSVKKYPADFETKELGELALFILTNA